MEPIIYHVDCNSFYASVSLLSRPELGSVPVAVGGSVEDRHGIILAKNEPAKKFGVRTAMPIWQAKKLCPDLTILPPEFPLYEKYSKWVKIILSEYTDLHESFGADESWLDVTHSVGLFGDSRRLAQEIRRRILRELGITVSIGVSWNKVFAKLGSDYKKPNAVTFITRNHARDERWKEIVFPLPVENLLYIGPATKNKLHKKYIFTIGQLAEVDRGILQDWFGKAGAMLFDYANGYDASPVSSESAPSQIKSIGNSTTTPQDLANDAEVKRLIHILCESVGVRLRDHHLAAATVELWVRDAELHSMVRQRKLENPTNLNLDLATAAFSLFRENYRWERPIRSLGVRTSGLSPDTEPCQCELGVDIEKRVKLENLEHSIDSINARFGKHCLRRAVAMTAFQKNRHPPL